MTDRLSLTNALAGADIEQQKAERIATEIYDAIHDNVATKSDLDLVRADLNRVEAALKADLQQLELRTHVRFETLERRIDGVLLRLGLLIVALTAVVLAAIRYLPHS